MQSSHYHLKSLYPLRIATVLLLGRPLASTA